MHDWIATFGLLILLVSVIANLMSVGIVNEPGTAPDPVTHAPGKPGRQRFNFWHFVVLAALIIAVLMIGMTARPTRIMQSMIDAKDPTGAAALNAPVASGSSSSTAVASGVVPFSTTLPIPAGFVFDPASGILKAPAPIPAGCVLVVKYDSGTPLIGDELAKGAIKGPGQTWVLPKDATNIQVLYWDQIKKEATPFVSPF